MSRRSRRERTRRSNGVALVGAGPGDPELLTLKAVRTLEEADAVLYDHLVSHEIRALCPPSATMIPVGKIGHGAQCSQSEINALMIALARAGKRVVRLKSGDPMIFGRAGEEIAALAAAGIEVDIVPGISAMQAAAASLKASLTHRDHARKLQVITGHSKNGAVPDDIDWHALSDPAATTAIYMGKHWAGALMKRFMDYGLPPACPAVAVLDASRPSEIIVKATAATLAGRLSELAFDAPCIILIGDALDAGGMLSGCETLISVSTP